MQKVFLFSIKYSEDFVNESLVFLIKHLCSYFNLHTLCKVFLEFCKNYLVLYFSIESNL